MSSRYRILETITHSENRDVFLAEDLWNQKTVILKTICPSAKSAWFQQFQTEVQVLKAIDSPWIPCLIESRQKTQNCWLAEEYIEGESLTKWLAGHKSKAERQRLFCEIIQRIRLVHQAGYLYMDLKADNIRIRNGHACLIDFNGCVPIGSAKPIFTNKDSLPPECLTGKRMDERADQIGLGKLWLNMNGPSQQAWTALARDPDHRYSSLIALEQAVCSPTRRKSGLGVMIGICLFAVLCSGLLFKDQLAGQPLLAEVFPAAKEQEALDESAAALCQRLEAANQMPSAREWLLMAETAMDTRHLPLAGYLTSHVPPSAEAKLSKSLLLLHMLQGSPLSEESLENGIQALGQAALSEEELVILFGYCAMEQVVLAESFVRNQLDALAKNSGQPKEPDDKLMASLMNYLLMAAAKSQQCTPVPQALKTRLQASCPDLYGLYEKAVLYGS